MRKFIITAELRDLEKQVSSGKISYSRMIELLNEKAEQYAENLRDEVSEKPEGESQEILLEKQRFTKAHIEALEDELRVIDNKIFYLKNPECGKYEN